MTKTPSLDSTDAASKAVQKTPNRVSLDSIKDRIVKVEYINPETVPHMTIAVLHYNNGFIFTGSSTPADPENFNEELGQQFAYEDAVRRIWPMEGFLLRERMSNIGDPG